MPAPSPTHAPPHRILRFADTGSARRAPLAAEAAGAPSSTRPRRSPAWIGVALVLATLVAYGPAFRAGFIWDDDAYVTGNAALDDLAGLARIWREPGATPQYYPLTFTTLWLEHQLYGDVATGYHVSNVLLHAANAILAWRVLAALGVPGAPFAAAIFAVHPVHVESVAWISERKNVLSAACYLGALLAALGLATADTAAARRRSLVVGAFFVAALLAKTVTCTLPVILLLVWWWRNDRLTGRDLGAALPLLALGLAAAPMTIWLEHTHVGAHGVHWDLSLSQRVLIAGRAVWFYAASLVWPHPLAFVYPRWQVDTTSLVQWLPPLAAVAVALGAWRGRDRLGKGPVVAIAGFAVTLAPALGFLDVYPMRYAFVADHYQYLASLFLIAPAAAVATALTARHRIAAPLLGVAGTASVLIVFAVLTWQRAAIFVDQETLWRDVIAKHPRATMAHINLAMWLQQQGRGSEALAALEAADRLEPDDADVHGNLGVVLGSLGRDAEARRHLERALALAPGSPQAHNNLANALAAAGDLDAAADHYRTAIRQDPRYAEAENNLANVLARRGALAEAIRHYEAALARDPRYVDAHANLATVLSAAGRNAEAIARYRDALRLAPNRADAAHGLGVQLAARGQWDEAVAYLARAVRGRPAEVAWHHQLAAALAGAGRTDEAIVAYGRALALRPDSADLHNDLGIAFAQRGDLDAAIAEFTRAVGLAPDHGEARGNLAAALAAKPPAAAP